MMDLQAERTSLARRATRRLRRLISVGDDLGYRPVVAETGVLLFILFIFAGAVSSALAAASLRADFVGQGWGASLPLTIAALTQVLYGFLVFRSRAYFGGSAQAWLLQVGLFVLGVFSLLVMLPALVGAASLVESVRGAFGMMPSPVVAHQTLERLRDAGWGLEATVICINAGLLVPIAEEFGWRGMLLPTLRRYRFSPLAANIVTATLFTAVHLAVLTDGAMMQAVVLLFILSLALGWLRLRTGSLAASIGLHAAFNLFNLLSVLTSTA